MKATGIVRRIDDLGRVVIPKEIRKTMRLREGEPLEIFIEKAGEVILRKYSPLADLTQYAADYADSVYQSSGLTCIICDRDTVAAAAGSNRKDLVERTISLRLEETIQEKKTVVSEAGSFIELTPNEEPAGYEIQAVAPVIAFGDAVGAVIIYAKDRQFSTEAAKAAAQTGALFLGKILE